MSYIIKEDDSSDNSKYRYPVVASEILMSSLVGLHDSLYKNNSIISLLYTFFDQDELPIHRTVLVCKVLCFFAENYSALTVNHIVNNPDTSIKLLIKHIYNSNIINILKILVVLEETEDGVDIVNFLNEYNLIYIFLETFAKSEPENYWQISKGFIDLMQVLDWSSVLMLECCSNQFVDSLLKMATENASTMKYLLPIYQHILYVLYTDLLEIEETVPYIVSKMETILPVLNSTLKDPPDDISIIGKKPIFGETRIKIIELLTLFLAVSYTEEVGKLLLSDVPNTLMDLFFEYNQNSVVHSMFSTFMITIINSPDEERTVEFLQHTKLVECLIKFERKNRKSPNMIQILPHIYKIGENLSNSLEYELIGPYVAEQKHWNSFNNLLYEVIVDFEALDEDSAFSLSSWSETERPSGGEMFGDTEDIPEDTPKVVVDEVEPVMELEKDEDLDCANDELDYEADWKTIVFSKEEIERSLLDIVFSKT
eukprot:TRINITY_DN527_c0_g1_i4.p1 TRINITY_DN527_c0_g1~~TRINITY_DN527_c0_g1_i4.p1  ORF type:complete len:483 (-),score=103.60 TRINITY_DN527_c0_g1_i4:15-1463(-)